MTFGVKHFIDTALKLTNEKQFPMLFAALQTRTYNYFKNKEADILVSENC